MLKFYLLVSLLLISGCVKKEETQTVKEIADNDSTVIEIFDEPVYESSDIIQQTKIDIALQYLNYHQRTHRKELQEFIGVDPVHIDWCAAFVNAVLGEHGLPGSDTVSEWPLTARSFLRWGKRVREPEVGDIVVFPRGTEAWQGHVGFYYGTEYRNGVKFYQILGGNQSNAVTIALFPARSAISIRRYATVENK